MAKNIVIVEDDPDQRSNYMDAISKKGYTVRAFGSREEALEGFDEALPDLEWFRYKRLSRSGWRAPHGMDSKQRRNYRYRGSLVRVGHGKVAEARGLHPSGFREVMVHNIKDLESIDPETQAARIGRTVGGRKREHIHARADELGIRVLNRRSGV